MKTRFIAACVALALGGCMVGPDYKRPDLNIPGGYTEAAGSTSDLQLPSDWWRLYGDRTLDELIASGLEKNPDIHAAIARMAEAEAVVREANATLLPGVDVNAAA